MISMIQLKQVLRNRRFVLFTILLPLAWYMFLYNIQADMLHFMASFVLNIIPLYFLVPKVKFSKAK